MELKGIDHAKKRKIVFFCPNQNHVTICDGLFTPLLGEPHVAHQPFFLSLHPTILTISSLPSNHIWSQLLHRPTYSTLSVLCSQNGTFLTTMRVSVLTEEGELHHLEFDSQMEVENIKALIEADVKIKDISFFICECRRLCAVCSHCLSDYHDHHFTSLRCSAAFLPRTNKSFTMSESLSTPSQPSRPTTCMKMTS